MTTQSAWIAARHYYFQPSTAFFRSFELEVYANTGIHLQHPILDLGCGDGTFGTMLQHSEILDSTDLAIDYSFDRLYQAQQKGLQSTFIQGDARALPFKSDHFHSVFSNGVVCCIKSDNEADLDQAISEIHRVLTHEGVLVLTVFTSKFDQNLLVPKILRHLGMSWLASRYLSHMTTGLGHYQVLDAERWLKKLQDSHFDIRQVHYYFTPYQGLWWNFFTLPPVSFWFKQLKSRGIRLMRHFGAYLLVRLFGLILGTRHNVAPTPETAGYVLIVAGKTSAASDKKSNQKASH